ncbi:MAG: helix-turn-helix domain-containing protein [Eubacterium sp.]|nr:helix-turn-helix domain-containing protein [Eubacterium sp.]
MSIKQGDYLKELRVKNKLSQEKLAEQLGLSRQSISKWEQGYALPDTDNLLKLSELYGISVDTLLKCGEAEEEKEEIEEQVQEAKDEEQTKAIDNKNEEKDAEVYKKPKKKRGWFFISYPVLMVIAYAIIGLVFKEHARGWITGWMVFLTIPLFYTGVIAAERKKPVIFCYPVLMALVYLIGGFFYGLWAYLWVVFLTIPVFYIIAVKIKHK